MAKKKKKGKIKNEDIPSQQHLDWYLTTQLGVIAQLSCHRKLQLPNTPLKEERWWMNTAQAFFNALRLC